MWYIYIPIIILLITIYAFYDQFRRQIQHKKVRDLYIKVVLLVFKYEAKYNLYGDEYHKFTKIIKKGYSNVSSHGYTILTNEIYELYQDLIPKFKEAHRERIINEIIGNK